MQSRKLTSRGISHATADSQISWITLMMVLHWISYSQTKVTGLNDAQLRQTLYKEGKDLTMEKSLHIFRIYAAKHKAQGTPINYLKGKGKGPGKGKPHPHNKNKKWGSQRGKLQNQGSKDKCGKCRKGTHQQAQKCPVAGQECQFCKKKGHYEVVCRKKKSTVH